MKERHIPHNELVAKANGELDSRREAEVREHLAGCWTCRTELRGIEETITDFVRAHQQMPLPPADGPRALLQAEMRRMTVPPPADWRDRFADFMLQGNRLAHLAGGTVALTTILFVTGVIQFSRQSFPQVPDPKITPGVTATISADEVCRSEPAEARIIPASVGREVFDRYGIHRPGPRDYELDYLISPELGGAYDPENFWPQPYGHSQWNAHVKDALEDRLHQLVCENKVSLETAQREIASNWIEAYKKYFQTEEPIIAHREFTKDRPWEP